MNNKNLFKNKTAKGLVSLITIIVLLSSMLATSIYYQNNITANVVKEISTETKSTGIIITEVNGIKELSQLNEGWYQIRNGFVFYLDTFNSYVQLYIRVKNPEHQNGLFVVDEDGNVRFDNYSSTNEKVIVDENVESGEGFSEFEETKITGAIVPKKEEKQVRLLYMKPTPKNYESFLDEATRKYGKGDNDFKNLLKAIATAESGWNPTAKSPKNAMGIMQLLPSTARGYKVDGEYVGIGDLFDPRKNILVGAQHFRYLLDKYNGNVHLALSAYNAGQRNVGDDIPLIRETQGYVMKVITAYEIEKKNIDLPQDGVTITIVGPPKIKISDFGEPGKIIVESVRVPQKYASIGEALKSIFLDIIGKPPGKVEPSPVAYYQDGNKVKTLDGIVFTRVKGVWVSTESTAAFNDEQIKRELKAGTTLFKESISVQVRELEKDKRYAIDYVNDHPTATFFDIVSDTLGSTDQKDINKYFKIKIDGKDAVVGTDENGRNQIFYTADVIISALDPITKEKVFAAKPGKEGLSPTQLKGTIEFIEIPQPKEIPTPVKRPIVRVPPKPPAVIYDFQYGDQVEIDGVVYIREYNAERGEAFWRPDEKSKDRVAKRDAEVSEAINKGAKRIPRETLEERIGKYSIEELKYIIESAKDEPAFDVSIYEKVLKEKEEQAKKEEKPVVTVTEPVIKIKGEEFEVVEIEGNLYYITIYGYSYNARDNKDGTYTVDIFGQDYKIYQEGVIELVEKLPSPAPPKAQLGWFKDTAGSLYYGTQEDLESLIKRGQVAEGTILSPNLPEERKKIIIMDEGKGKLADRFTKLEETSQLKEGNYQLDRETGIIRDSKNNIVGFLDVDVAKKQPSSDLIVERDDFGVKYALVPSVPTPPRLTPIEQEIKERMKEELQAIYDSSQQMEKLLAEARAKELDAQLQERMKAELEAMYASSQQIEKLLAETREAQLQERMKEELEAIYSSSQQMEKLLAQVKDEQLQSRMQAELEAMYSSYEQMEKIRLQLATQPPVAAPTPSPAAPPSAPTPERKIRQEYINTGDKPQKITVEGKTIEIPVGYAYDPETKRLIPIRKKQEVVGAPTQVPGEPRKPQPIKEFVREDGVPVYVYPIDKATGLQTIDIGGKEHRIHQDLLKGALLDKWDGVSIQNIPISGGTREVIINPITGEQKAINTFISIDQSTQQIRTTKTVEIVKLAERGKLTGDTKTTTISNPGTEKAEKKEEIQFADDTTKTTKFKGDRDIKEKVTYKTKEGKTLELSGDDLKVEERLGTNADRILKLAVEEGFRSAKLDDQERLVEGNKKIQFIDDKEKRILVFDGERVTKENTVVNGDTFSRVYLGTVKYVAGEAIMEKGASYETYSKGKLVQSGGISNDGLSKFEAKHIESGIKLTVTSGDVSEITIEEITVGQQINDPKSPVDGMYKFIKSGEELYYDEGILGTNVYRLVEKDGKQVAEKVQIFQGTAQALSASITKQRARYEKKPFTVFQEKSQRFFAEVERVLTEFQGLGYYATLFFDEDSLLQWRDKVDRYFATAYLGTEYWSSAICGNYLDGEDEGIAYAETPQGLAQVAAHIEATRTEAIETPTGREFIYKITFNIRNGDFDKDPRAPEEMNINVILKGERTATVFKQEQKVKRGSSFGRTGRSAIVQDSTTFFNEVCLTFDKVPFRWKVSNNEICNVIVESSGAPTPISTTATTTTASSGTAEGDINDF